MSPADIMAMADLPTVEMDHQLARLRALLTNLLGASSSVLHIFSTGDEELFAASLTALQRATDHALQEIDK